MKLPKLPILDKKSKPKEYFLSLVLRDEKASAVVFEEVNNRVNVVGEHEEHFKTSLNAANEDELLDTLDKAVSGAEKNLPPDTESQKTIFGVNQDWISDGKIKAEYLAKLKKISDELEFKPMGFLVIPEAVVHLLAKEEGQPISGILTEINDKTLTVYLVKAGKIIETKNAPIEGPIPETVDHLLQKSTTTEILPSRIIIFNGGNEKLQQEFLSHKWSKALPFLHVPQITNLSANYDARSVLNGAATQMGLSVFEASLTKAVKEDQGVVEALDETSTKSVDANISDEDKTIAEAASEFGFSSVDVKSKNKPVTAIDEELIPKKGSKSDNINTDNITAADQFKEIPEEVKIESSDSKPLSVNAAAISIGMKNTLSKLKLGSVLKGGGKSPKIILAATIPLVLLLILGYLFFFGRTATVTLSLDQRDETKTEEITFSEDEATNAGDNVISARFISVDEEGKSETATTGKKETGDKAKGTVTIFNTADSGKTIAAGTVITSSNDLKFVTDKAVTVASGSADPTSLKAGEADVTVTAEKFGTNYNLPSGTKFSFDGTSEIAAKNDKAFSGGTKKEIKVVSKKDQDKLAKDLEEQLKSSAADEIRKQASGYEVLPDFISITFDKKSFSKDVDDEADNVSLTAIISYEGVAYKKTEAAAYANEKFKNNDNLSVNEDSVIFDVESLEEDDGEAVGKVTIKAGLIPEINKEKIAQEIKGKSQTDARSAILSMPGVKDVEIKTSLSFLPLPKTLPFSTGKINIVANK